MRESCACAEKEREDSFSFLFEFSSGTSDLDRPLRAKKRALAGHEPSSSSGLLWAGFGLTRKRLMRRSLHRRDNREGLSPRREVAAGAIPHLHIKRDGERTRKFVCSKEKEFSRAHSPFWAWFLLRSLSFTSSAAFSTAAPARRVVGTFRTKEEEEFKRKGERSRFHFFDRALRAKLSTSKKKNPQPPFSPFFPSSFFPSTSFSSASRTSALPVRAFKESGAPSSKSGSKQGGLRALKNIELPKVDLSKIDLPAIDLPKLDELKLPTGDDVSLLAAETASKVSSAWEASEEKPAVVALGISALVVLVALSAVANAVDSVPVFSNLLELVGLGVSGWFAYRNLVFGPDRDALKGNIEAWWSKIFS